VASLSVISWRDIPSQVVVKRGRETAKRLLSHRFQEAVDRAAMRAGKTGSEAYIADWKRSEPRPCGNEIDAEAQAEAARLEALYSDDDLLRLIRAHGVDDSKPQPRHGPTENP
jgi:Virulence factor